MDLRSGQCFWPLKNGLLGVYPALARDVRCDVVVVGAGITGALVAHRLAGAGVDFVVLDGRDVGWGSTLASTSILQYEIDVPLHKLAAQIGEEEAARAYRLCLGAIDRLDRLTGELADRCDFEWKPSLYLASRKSDLSDLEREYRARAAAGIQVELLTKAQLAACSSLTAPGAIRSAAAAQVDAYRLTHALLADRSGRAGGGVAGGIRVFDRTKVERYEHGPDGVAAVTDRGPIVRAKTIVFATGYESQSLLRERVVELKSTYALATEPIDEFAGWPDRCIIWETARPYYYLRTTPDGRAMIGGEDEPFRDPERRDRLIPAKRETLMARFAEMFPAIQTEPAYTWAGTFGETKDGLAYIGATPEYDGALFALGFGGNGMTFSVIAADVILDLYEGRESRDAGLFRFGR